MDSLEECGVSHVRRADPHMIHYNLDVKGV